MSMIFTGSNGVGKTLTADRVGKMLMRGCDWEKGEPKGVLKLYGADYADDNALLQNKDVSSSFSADDVKNEEANIAHNSKSVMDARTRFVRDIVDHLNTHNYNSGAVIIISEMERMSAYVLDALAKAFDGSKLSYEGSDIVHTAVLGKVLFLFTTDLGSPEIFRSIQEHEGMNNISSAALGASIRKYHFGEVWNNSLELVKVSDEELLWGEKKLLFAFSLRTAATLNKTIRC